MAKRPLYLDVLEQMHIDWTASTDAMITVTLGKLAILNSQESVSIDISPASVNAFMDKYIADRTFTANDDGSLVLTVTVKERK